MIFEAHLGDPIRMLALRYTDRAGVEELERLGSRAETGRLVLILVAHGPKSNVLHARQSTDHRGRDESNQLSRLLDLAHLCVGLK